MKEEAPQAAFNIVLHVSVFVFTSALVWFSFVYYPKVVSDFRSGKIPLRPLVPQAIAASAVSKFPIATNNFKIEEDSKTMSYTAYVSGDALDKFVENKQTAELALKSALSADNLCTYKVVFASSNKLNVPSVYTKPSGC